MSIFLFFTRQVTVALTDLVQLDNDWTPGRIAAALSPTYSRQWRLDSRCVVHQRDVDLLTVGRLCKEHYLPTQNEAIVDISHCAQTQHPVRCVSLSQIRCHLSLLFVAN